LGACDICGTWFLDVCVDVGFGYLHIGVLIRTSGIVVARFIEFFFVDLLICNADLLSHKVGPYRF
jgi:hypothetical protein